MQRLKKKLHRRVVGPAPGHILGAGWIPLGNKIFTLVDLDLYDFLNQWNWHLRSRHAMRNRTKEDDTGTGWIHLHRAVLGAVLGAQLEPDQKVDHVNRDPLDNRAVNLRIASDAQNSMNRAGHGKSSVHKGVVRRTGRKTPRPWEVRIKADGRSIWLGSYLTENEAGRVYDAAARKYFGEFAYLNFPAEDLRK